MLKSRPKLKKSYNRFKNSLTWNLISLNSFKLTKTTKILLQNKPNSFSTNFKWISKLKKVIKNLFFWIKTLSNKTALTYFQKALNRVIFRTILLAITLRYWTFSWKSFISFLKKNLTFNLLKTIKTIWIQKNWHKKKLKIIIH